MNNLWDWEFNEKSISFRLDNLLLTKPLIFGNYSNLFLFLLILMLLKYYFCNVCNSVAMQVSLFYGDLKEFIQLSDQRDIFEPSYQIQVYASSICAVHHIHFSVWIVGSLTWKEKFTTNFVIDRFGLQTFGITDGFTTILDQSLN